MPQMLEGNRIVFVRNFRNKKGAVRISGKYIPYDSLGGPIEFYYQGMRGTIYPFGFLGWGRVPRAPPFAPAEDLAGEFPESEVYCGIADIWLDKNLTQITVYPDGLHRVYPGGISP